MGLRWGKAAEARNLKVGAEGFEPPTSRSQTIVPAYNSVTPTSAVEQHVSVCIMPRQFRGVAQSG